MGISLQSNVPVSLATRIKPALEVTPTALLNIYVQFQIHDCFYLVWKRNSNVLA